MLACLRMVLAYCGTNVTEPVLVEQVSLDEGGLDPEALAVLAKRYDLNADARQLDIAAVIERHRFPILLVDRSFLDDEFCIHAVIPVRFTRHYVGSPARRTKSYAAKTLPSSSPSRLLGARVVNGSAGVERLDEEMGAAPKSGSTNDSVGRVGQLVFYNEAIVKPRSTGVPHDHARFHTCQRRLAPGNHELAGRLGG
jgi:Peptidase C39 family